MFKKRQIPNLITLTRGILTMIIIGLFYTDISIRYQIILGLFILAVATDVLDGELSRKWKCVSKFGIVFDSMLDKVLVLSVLMLLIPYQLLPTIVFVLLLIRELIVDSIKNYFLAEGKPIGAKKAGKNKMTAEVIMISLLIIRLFNEHVYWKIASEWLAVIALILAYWSAGEYLIQWRREIKK